MSLNQFFSELKETNPEEYERFKQAKREAYHTNPEPYREYRRKYYQANKQKEDEYHRVHNAEKIQCECGESVRRDYIKRHKKTAKHKSKLQPLI